MIHTEIVVLLSIVDVETDGGGRAGTADSEGAVPVVLVHALFGLPAHLVLRLALAALINQGCGSGLGAFTQGDD